MIWKFNLYFLWNLSQDVRCITFHGSGMRTGCAFRENMIQVWGAIFAKQNLVYRPESLLWAAPGPWILTQSRQIHGKNSSFHHFAGIGCLRSVAAADSKQLLIALPSSDKYLSMYRCPVPCWLFSHYQIQYSSDHRIIPNSDPNPPVPFPCRPPQN